MRSLLKLLDNLAFLLASSARMGALLFIFLLPQPALSYNLDGSVKKVRPIFVPGPNGCVEKGEAETTAIDESIQRGNCEPYAEPIGSIIVRRADGLTNRGVGTLIAPNAILTAAHVLKDCLLEGTKCNFAIDRTEEGTKSVVKSMLNPDFGIEVEPMRVGRDSKGKKVWFSPPSSNDIAIGILAEPFSRKYQRAILPLRVVNDEFVGTRTLFGASINQIVRNETGNKYLETFSPHIMEAAVKSNNHWLIQAVSFDKEEVEKSCKSKDAPFPLRFINEQNSDNSIFLTGTLLPGDSGSPLVIPLGNTKYEIIAVAVGTDLMPELCTVFSNISNPAMPDAKVNAFDYWESTLVHLWWIREALKENNVDIARYQPGLLQLSKDFPKMSDYDVIDEIGPVEIKAASPQDLENSRASLKNAAEAGLSEAQFKYASMLENGRGGPQDLANARAYYKKAADQGNAMAQKSYADMLKFGEGGPQDLVNARVYYQKAADLGNAMAQNSYADMLERGEGGDPDLASARSYYQKAADQGHAMAKYWLARMLISGKGGPKDLDLAKKLLIGAASQGIKEAQQRLNELAAAENAGNEGESTQKKLKPEVP